MTMRPDTTAATDMPATLVLPPLPPEFAHLSAETAHDHGLTALYGPEWDLDPLREMP